MNPQRIFLVGPTASGKGAVAVALARELHGEVLSLDSMKIYRGMDLGTNKLSESARRGVRIHLVDLVGPEVSLSVADYCRFAEAADRGVRSRGRRPIYAGGTALYLKALTEGLFEGPPADPAIRERLRAEAASAGTDVLHDRLHQCDPVAAARLHPHDLRRVIRALEVFEKTGVPISSLQKQWSRAPRPDRILFGLRWERSHLYQRIDRRVDDMMANGFLEEVRALASRPDGVGRGPGQALGYRELLAWLDTGEPASLTDVVAVIKQNTRRFAKQQLTFFRQFPDLEWIDLDGDRSAEDVVDEIVDRIRHLDGNRN
jgi:tRNA dimethylallyltransferase